MTKPLIETNPYLRDPKKREEMLERNARESSAFEGARGLKKPSQRLASDSERRTASKKKWVKRA